MIRTVILIDPGCEKSLVEQAEDYLVYINKNPKNEFLIDIIGVGLGLYDYMKKRVNCLQPIKLLPKNYNPLRRS